jgi:hypothetical protein
MEIRYNKAKTGYTHYILNTGHEYENLEDTVDVVEQQHKEPYLNMVEKFNIISSWTHFNYFYYIYVKQLASLM